MKINYANNPLLGRGKWDPLLSLLTPGGDAIVIPPELFFRINFRCHALARKNIAFFSLSSKNGICKVWRIDSRIGRHKEKSALTLQLEAMKVGDAIKAPESTKKNLSRSCSRLKAKGIGEYLIFHEFDKLCVKRIK